MPSNTKVLTKKIHMKGGSLSGTYHCADETGREFVRKEVSLKVNREYGFQRWYSQLKRLQRYYHLFPSLFPKLIGYGIEGELGYFDIEYFDNSFTVHEFLSKNPDPEQIDCLFIELKNKMAILHREKIISNIEAIDLYVYEEVEQKINACKNNARFQKLISDKFIYFNGKKITGLYWSLAEFKDLCRKTYSNPIETFTHGNMTLENILYQPKENKIIFIDPYEENVIDSTIAEYSQILQSSNSHYEIYNSAPVKISGNEINISIEVPPGIQYFNKIFSNFLQVQCTAEDIKMVRLFEISQYARMLPFKMAIDEDKMILFYAIGSNLFNQLKQDWSK